MERECEECAQLADDLRATWSESAKREKLEVQVALENMAVGAGTVASKIRARRK